MLVYCINCGVKLAETEKKCPLCNTVVCHPDFNQSAKQPLYPADKLPKNSSGGKALSGAVLILFLIPMIVCLFADLSINGRIEWFGYVAGAMTVTYVSIALPFWFKKPNPVIFVPCSFAAITLYLFYINFATDGDWFFTFALPLICGLCIITSATVTLVRYIKRGRLYIFGGAFMLLGSFMLLIEHLLSLTFGLSFIGWSIYPLGVFELLGGLLIYLAIDSDARETLERKLFF